MYLVNGRPGKNEYGDMSLERMNTINGYLRSRFNNKMIKLSLDGGFTCPNRDGSKGFGGCIFCSNSGSGEFASDIESQINLLKSKWPGAGYLAYFQNHTNTYAKLPYLKEKFEPIIANPNINGLVIGTRPDCLSNDILDYLEDISKRTFLWIELGLQTIHEHTANLINRCYDLSVYDEAMRNLNSRNIKTVSHLILGLPGENREDMISSVKYVCNSGTWGIKLHLLNVIKGSSMEKTYPGYVSFESLEDYVNLVCDMIEIIPQDIIIHRLTGDAERKILISPEWSYKKRTILNSINKELERRDSWQGCKLQQY